MRLTRVLLIVHFIHSFISNPQTTRSISTTQSDNLTEQRITKSDRHSLGLSVVVKRSLSELTANTRLLVTTEGHLVVQSVVAVDPNGTRLERVGDLNGGVEVGGVDGGGETVGGRVTDADGLLLGLELGDGAHGAEDLLLHDLHVFSDVGEDGGLDEETLVTLAVATGLDLGACILAGLDVAVIELSVYVLCLYVSSPTTYLMMRSNWT